MKFRQDLNGLRAIAVIAVVLFHFNNNWIPGGFAGVDVFFVISGFLMTGIIFSGISNGTFNILAFYKARTKRIIPALTILCLSVLIFGWFFIAPTDYQTVSRHVFTSLTFTSNVAYWQEAGYFDAISKSKLLLHTWSLSVEWQFYIIYPLLIAGLFNFLSEKNVKKTILGLFAFSFVISIYSCFKWPDASYYLLPTRSWEMLLGGIIYLFPIRTLEKHASIASTTGGFLILLSFVIMSEDDIWPGYLALLPTIGSAIVLSANNRSNFILNNIIIQKIGSWSYSIYLWHWVVLGVIYYFDPFFGIEKQLLGIFLSIIFGYLSYQLIERNNYYKASVITYITVLLFSLYAWTNNGVKSPLREYTAQYDLKDWAERYKNASGAKLFGEYWSACNSKTSFNPSTKTSKVEDKCINMEEKDSVFLLGDSHAGAYSSAIRSIFKDDIYFNQLASSSCRPSWDKRELEGETSSDSISVQSCQYQNKLSYEVIEEIRPRVVILAQRNKHDRPSLKTVVDKLADWGVEKIIVIGPVPQWYPSLPSVLSKNNRKLGDFLISTSLDKKVLKTNETLKAELPKYKKIVFIDVVSNFCKKVGDEIACKYKIDDNNLVTFDYGHPTPEYSDIIVDQLLREHLPNDMLKQ